MGMGANHQDERDPEALATISCLDKGDRFMWGDREWIVVELDEGYTHMELADLEERNWNESGRRRIKRSDLCSRLDKPGSGVVSLD